MKPQGKTRQREDRDQAVVHSPSVMHQIMISSKYGSSSQDGSRRKVLPSGSPLRVVTHRVAPLPPLPILERRGIRCWGAMCYLDCRFLPQNVLWQLSSLALAAALKWEASLWGVVAPSIDTYLPPRHHYCYCHSSALMRWEGERVVWSGSCVDSACLIYFILPFKFLFWQFCWKILS